MTKAGKVAPMSGLTLHPISATFKDPMISLVPMPPRTFEGTSICVRAAPKLKGSKALRLTVPRIIVEFMELKPGDAVHWVAETASGRVTVSRTTRSERRT